jgi:hypothetical protein
MDPVVQQALQDRLPLFRLAVPVGQEDLLRLFRLAGRPRRALLLALVRSLLRKWKV